MTITSPRQRARAAARARAKAASNKRSAPANPKQPDDRARQPRPSQRVTPTMTAPIGATSLYKVF